MKALILAAGLGSRLYPLTETKPKALVKYNGTILLKSAIDFLKNGGVDEIIVNVHHFADQIIDFIDQNEFGIPISISDERDYLLETGGALKFASQFFDQDPFIVYNVDVITDLNLKRLISYHRLSDSLASIVVRQRKTQRYLLFDNELRLCGWENKKTKDIILKRESDHLQNLAFSGIHILNPEIFNKIPSEWKRFSIIDLYLNLARDNEIKAFIDEKSKWLDIGKPEHLKDLT